MSLTKMSLHLYKYSKYLTETEEVDNTYCRGGRDIHPSIFSKHFTGQGPDPTLGTLGMRRNTSWTPVDCSMRKNKVNQSEYKILTFSHADVFSVAPV